MENRNYWLDLFTGTTWEEFRSAGSKTSGFRESRWKSAQQIKPGDYLLCYLTGVSRFIGLLEVLSPAFKDKSPIWKDEDFPCRLKVQPLIELTPETAVPVHSLKDVLSCFKISESPYAWTGRFRSSPTRWSKADGEAVVAAMIEAKKNPVARKVDPKKLARRPKTYKADFGPITIPDLEQEEPIEKAIFVAPSSQQPSDHTEIQALLLRLGADMGYNVWVAANDRNREFNGLKFCDFPKIKKELPLQFDDATNRIISLIDVLWLKGNAIVSAFEVESTTSIYSGLLRMSDLISMQPNLKIPLYLVAPDERRNKVIAEVNRPTFSRLKPPLTEICRYISFDVLIEEVEKIRPIIKYVKPEYLEEISESCEPEEG